MAYFDTYNVQFLDLTGVDDEERNWLLASLQSTDAPVEGPWSKPKKVNNNNNTINVVSNTSHAEHPLEPLEVEHEFVVIPGPVQYPISPQVYPPPSYQPPIPLYNPYLTTHYGATTMVSPVPVVSRMVPATMVPINAPMVQVASHFTQPIVPFSPNNYGLVQQQQPQQQTQQHSPQPNQANIYNMVNNNVSSKPVVNPLQEPVVHVKHSPVLQTTTISNNGPANNVVDNSPQTPIVNNNNNIKRVSHERKSVAVPEQQIAPASSSTPPKVENNGLSNHVPKETVCENSEANVGKSWASLFNSNKKNQNASDAPAVSKAANAVLHEGRGSNASGTKSHLEHSKHNPKKNLLADFADPNYFRMAEILVNYQPDHRIISLQPRGLINKSNYCYINSILQAMLACPPVYNLFHKLSEIVTLNENRKYTRIIDNMIKFVREFQHLPPGQRVSRRSDNKQQQHKKDHATVNCDRAFEPNWIYKMLNGIRSDSFIVEGRQEDAEEFLGCLLNGLNDEMMELMKLVSNEENIQLPMDDSDKNGGEKEWQVIGPKNKGSVTRRTEIVRTPISSIFGGYIRSRVHRYGDQITDNIQPFFTLQLNIEKVNTVREALEALVLKNQLEGVTSSKTNEEVEAWQQVTIEELPVVLILHLKCFDFKPDGCAKIIKALEFPVDLKIDSKLLSLKNNYQGKEKQYKLFAVVYHDGKEATKGHYLTDAYHVGYASWLRYDDSMVSSVQEEQVLKPTDTRVPYLLFYRRCDTVRSK